MTAQLIDGKALAAQVQAEAAQRSVALRADGIEPHLTVILVGDDPASQVYVRSKVQDSQKTGLKATLERYPADMPQEQLLRRIAALNADGGVHGILVQLPLPAHMHAQRVLEAIAPHKDVDGFHAMNAGALVTGQPGFRPCTPSGCMKMLQSIGMGNLRGKNAVVIGRSNIVGKPMALMLLAADATVSICHSGTKDLAAYTRAADVVDVGMNRNDEGKLCGDVDFDAVREVAGWITPVPGGVGPMTRAMLLVNTLEAAEKAAERA